MERCIAGLSGLGGGAKTMKLENLDKEVFDSLFLDLVREKTRWGACIIATRDFAEKLWEKYRIPYKAKAEVVRTKMREWWNSYERKSDPRPHKMVCGIAVYLSQPMSYGYCNLGRTKSMMSLICVYQNQKEFRREKIE